ncbi:unnamed protein product, partial [Closterium sp. NIES-53]
SRLSVCRPLPHLRLPISRRSEPLVSRHVSPHLGLCRASRRVPFRRVPSPIGRSIGGSIGRIGRKVFSAARDRTARGVRGGPGSCSCRGRADERWSGGGYERGRCGEGSSGGGRGRGGVHGSSFSAGVRQARGQAAA